jgi:hypothetical protein
MASSSDIAWSYFELLSEGRLEEAVELLDDDGSLWNSGTRTAMPFRELKDNVRKLWDQVPMRFVRHDAWGAGRPRCPGVGEPRDSTRRHAVQQRVLLRGHHRRWQDHPTARVHGLRPRDGHDRLRGRVATNLISERSPRVRPRDGGGRRGGGWPWSS